MIGPMLFPMTSSMFDRVIGGAGYSNVVLTSELLQLLVLGRLKRAYERTVL